jgi:hypothetical protein
MKKKLFLLSLAPLICSLGLSGQAAVLLQDDFSYADGSLITVSSPKWSHHSGTTPGQVEVSSGKVILSQTETEDVNATLDGQPYGPNGLTNILYAKFTVSFSALPTANGGYYFAHFKDGSPTAVGNHRTRIFMMTNGAPAGMLRLGLGNGSSSATITNSTDLSLNTTYTIVARHVINSFSGTLWIDPVNENSASVTAPDSQGAFTVSSYAFRQNGNSASPGSPTVAIDDLVVGTQFSDVVPGSSGSNPAFIAVQPVSTNVTVGSTASFSVIAGGDAPLAYQWQFNGTNLDGANSSTLTLVNVTLDQAGPYNVIVSNGSGPPAFSSSATLTVTAAPEPPAITNQPQSQMALVGGSVTFNVGASGTPPLTYHWRFNGTNNPGSPNAATYTLSNLATTQSGPYDVVVSNSVGSVTSIVAQLTVTPPPPTNIAYLHTLVDSNYNASSGSALFTAEGIVTTHVNMTGSTNVLFYMQDNTAGIAVFWSGGGAANVPPIRARVRVTAPLASFNGLLEMSPAAANAQHSVAIVSSNNPLPAAQTFAFSAQDNAAILDPLEGSFVVASNVFIDLTVPTFVSGANVTLTNESGDLFVLFVNAQTDVVGQTKPAGPLTIFGVLGQFDTSNPRTSLYELTPTAFADILSATKAPTVRFTNVLSNLVRPGDLPTNTFREHALRPGETLTMSTIITDPDGGIISITPMSNGLPATASWSYGATSGTSVVATFTFTPSQASAGQNYTVVLRTANSQATNDSSWTIYVPTLAEQGVLIGEFLANPSSNTNAPHFNPLRRNLPLTTTTGISTIDEYIEIVNISAQDVDLIGWTVSDAVGVRHQFGDTFPLTSSNAVIVYGGPLNGDVPNLPVSSIPSSDGSVGLALNNTGTETMTLRNYPDNRMICRVFYREADLSATASLTRFPTMNSPFIANDCVATNAVSPGTQFDGRPFSQPATLVGVGNIVVSVNGSNVTLDFPALVGPAYSLWHAANVTDRFCVSATTSFNSAAGQFSLTNGAVNHQFYFITRP